MVAWYQEGWNWFSPELDNWCFSMYFMWVRSITATARCTQKTWCMKDILLYIFLFCVACFRSKYVSRIGFRGHQLPHRSQPADHQREWDVIALCRVRDVDERAFHRKPLKLLTQCQQNVISNSNQNSLNTWIAIEGKTRCQHLKRNRLRFLVLSRI